MHRGRGLKAAPSNILTWPSVYLLPIYYSEMEKTDPRLVQTVFTSCPTSSPSDYLNINFLPLQPDLMGKKCTNKLIR